MKNIVLADRDNCKIVSEDLRLMWVRDILFQTGMNLEGCYNEDPDIVEQTIHEKANLRKKLNENDILIIDNKNDGTKIYIQSELIAEWKHPSFSLKKDLSQLDPKKKLFVEISLEYWSVFDDEIIKSDNELE